MSKRPSFIPGRPAAAQPPLARYRPQQPIGVARGYVRSLTAPGGLVVDLFCQGPRFAREALEARRRAVGLSINPLLLLAARLGLARLDPHALNAGFTHLADSPRGDKPLRSHLTALYRTRCPACNASAVAEWFAWRRESEQPFQKGVRCHSCGGLQVGASDREDAELAQSFAPRGLPYYYALDRAAPLTRQAPHPARERAAELVECYTPRNLSALMDLSRRVAGIEAAGGVVDALMAILLDCYDRCSKLYPYGEDRGRPRTLRIPVRYMEWNVWLCFEEGLSRVLKNGSSPSVSEAEDVDDLVRGAREGHALVACAARDAREILPDRSVDLLLVEPPRPDGVFWALSALWAAWLWDSSEAHAMRPFLRRRRFDWHWHWRVLQEALNAVGPLLKEDALLVVSFGGPDLAMLQSVCLAASTAGYRLHTWGCEPEIGYRSAWRWEGTGRPRSPFGENPGSAVVTAGEDALVATLRCRGEPTSGALLRAAVYAHLTDRNLLSSPASSSQEVDPVDFLTDAVDEAFATAPIAHLAGRSESEYGSWWLLDPQEGVDTLADRVEGVVRRLLAEHLVWRENDLINAVYARFPDDLTPDLELVRVCIDSYSVRDGHEIHLRPEDDFQRRRLEIVEVCQDLVRLGQELGFRTAAGEAWDVRWLRDEGGGYRFLVSATAMLATEMLGEEMLDLEDQCCLVVPGGRARLIHVKLQRDARLAQAVDTGRWQFIKFRHLRRLVAEEDLDRHAFTIVLGLDPIAEREHTQLPLF